MTTTTRTAATELPDAVSITEALARTALAVTPGGLTSLLSVQAPQVCGVASIELTGLVGERRDFALPVVTLLP